MITFKDLNLNNAIWNALDDAGLVHPTTIQKKTIPVIMSGRDVLGIAQTGTGKTLAYLLPLLRSWSFNRSRHASTLIIVPTRELAVQVMEEAVMLTKYMNIVVRAVYGGTNLKTQAYEVAEGVDILVGTPGRILDLGYHGTLNFKLIKKLVIDEVDETLALGFRSQLEQILDLLPEKRQNLLFSATITDDVEILISDYFNNPERIEAAPSGTPLTNIQQQLYRIPNFNTKFNLLEYLLKNNPEMSKVLVFVSTKAMADALYNKAAEIFTDQVGVIHSNKDQNFRFNAVRNFSNGTVRILIATDVIARGIDIDDVTHVINFDLPDEPQNYVHRIGRTGRADKMGVSIAFAGDLETESLQQIEDFMNYDIPRLPLPGDVEVSDVLIDSEIPTIQMKNVLTSVPKLSGDRAAFHSKKLKNTKTNKKTSHKEKMQAKYGKPKTRRQKVKGKK